MKHLLFTALVCLAELTTGTVFAQPAADAQPRVGRWGEIARLEFHGVRTFKTNDVVNALLQSPEFLLAAHPAAPRNEFAPALQKALVAGYLSGGFRDAQAVVTLDEARQRVRVEVAEGPRFRCGTVRVVNAKKLPVAEVIRRLTQKVQVQADSFSNDMFKHITSQKAAQQQEVVWQAGETVSFGSQATETRRKEVEKVLAACGFYFAKFALRLEPQRNSDRMDLVVDVQSEGAAGSLDKIEVTGLTRHTPAQFLSWLGVKSGQRLTFDLIPRLEGRIVESGRFLAQRVTPEQVVGNAGQVGLKIEVREFTNSPMLGQAFSVAEQQLLRTRAWTEDAFRRGEEFVVEVRLTNVAITNIGLKINSRVQVALRRDAVAVLNWSGDKLERGFITTTNRLLYVSADSGRRFEVPIGASVRVTGAARITMNPDPQDTNSLSNVSFEFGMAKQAAEVKSPVELSFELTPAAMINRARRPGMKSRTERGVSHLTFAEESWRIRAATGELVEFLAHSKADEGGDFGISLRPQRGAIANAELAVRAAGAGRPNSLATNLPLASAVGVIAAEFVESPLLALWMDKVLEPARVKPTASALQRLAVSGILDPLDQWLGWDPADDKFSIPTELPPPNLPALMRAVWSQLSAWAHRFTQEHLPAGSWPATLTREAVMLFGGNPKYAEPELTRILESPQTGPLGCLAAAELLAQAGNQGGSAIFAERGLQRLSPEHFRRDASLLLDIADSYTRRAGRPVAVLTTLPADELAALASLLPPSARGFLLRAVGALKLQPDRGLREVLEPLLADWWQGGLQNEVESALRRTLAGANTRAAVQKLFDEAVARLQGSDGRPAQPAEAAQLFLQAAQRGSHGAAYYLGMLHEKGTGVERNFAEALKWFAHAATNGVTEAQMKLGDVFSNGFDGPTDYLTATFWYRLAQLGGNPIAGVMGDVTARKLTPEQHAEVARRLKALAPNTPAGGATSAPPKKR